MKYILILTCIILFWGCNGTQSQNGQDPLLNESLTTSALTAFPSCDDLLTVLKQQTIRRMEKDMDRYKSCSLYGPQAQGMPVPSSVESRFTPTNLQEEGVDEGDTIKTDGEHIFVLTQTGVDIFKAWPISDFHKVASYSFPETTSNSASSPALSSHQAQLSINPSIQPLFFLKDRKLIILRNLYSTTKIIHLDVTDPSHPRQVLEKIIAGYSIQSRIVGKNLHVALSHYLQSQNPRLEWPTIDWTKASQECSDPARKEAFLNSLDTSIAAAKETNRQRIERATLEDWIPTLPEAPSLIQENCRQIVHDPSLESSDGLILLYSLNLEDSHQEKTTAVLGSGYQVYASPKSFYLAGSDANDTTRIHRFAINTEDQLHQYIASRAVPGYILNSFSMGEDENTFHIATTVGHVSGEGNSEVSNNVYAMDTAKADLPVVGRLEKIAQGEQIYAVRFVGSKGYLVTFKKVDPLFVVNLKDPQHLVIEGELQMPGFSTYLHPLDENHLIGLGKDAEDQGTFAWFQGVKLALFDVTPGQTPASVDQTILGSRGTYSEALSDHHAFTFDKPSGLLALPISLYEGGHGGSDVGEFRYHAVELFEISSQKILKKGEVQLPAGATSPQRVLVMGSGNNRALYILDQGSLYQATMEPSFSITKREPVNNQRYEVSYDMVARD